MMTHADKAERFRAMHLGGCFVIPNAWDAGSARILATLGFAAIATTSAGLAFMLGRRDGQACVSRAEAIANAAGIAGATELPVSADLENGYGAGPEDCAETVRQAAAAGLCGCTIEDTTADPASPIHGFDAAVRRVRAAVAAARSAPRPFVLTARAEHLLYGTGSVDDTVKRLVAFAEVGADCLYAPGLPDLAAVRSAVEAVAPRPLNVLSGPGDGLLPLRALSAFGARRVSVGGALARAAYGQVLEIGRMLGRGDLPEALAGIAAHAEIQAMMEPSR